MLLHSWQSEPSKLRVHQTKKRIDTRTHSRSKDECERHCYETLGVCTTGLSYPMSSSRYRAFYFVFNIFTGHVILLKHCSDVKYQYDRPHGKWRPHLYSLIYCSFFGALFWTRKTADHGGKAFLSDKVDHTESYVFERLTNVFFRGKVSNTRPTQGFGVYWSEGGVV